MHNVFLGNTGEKISCLALGTMYFGSGIDEQTSFDILDQYVSYGGSLLDSANKYASWVPSFRGGESECLIGKWIKKRHNRENIFITSKVGFPYGDVPRSLRKEIIISECEKSLKRLGLETIDLYFAHAYDPETGAEEFMEAFHQLKMQGKIRFAGASNFFAWQIREANAAAELHEWEGFSCIQQRHTYLEPSLRADFGTQLVLTPEIEIFCSKNKLAIMAYSPLLGGAYVRKDRLIPVQYQNAINNHKLKNLYEVAGELEVSPNAVVLAWMMQNSPEIVPVVAGSSLNQMKENLQALSFSLSECQLKQLNEDIAEQHEY